MKKILSAAAAVAMLASSAMPALANEGKKNGFGDNSKEVRQEFKDERKELKTEFKDKMEKLKDDFKENKKIAKQIFVRRAVTVQGTLTGVTSSTVTVTVTAVSPAYNPQWEKVVSTTPDTYPAVGKNLVATVTNKTQFVRHFSGKTNTSEFSVGDKMKIQGSIMADGTMQANVVKDESIENTGRMYLGTVQSVNAGAQTFVITRANSSSTITVSVGANTKFNKMGATTTSFGDIQVGSKVGVRGLFNTRLNQMKASVIRFFKSL